MAGEQLCRKTLSLLSSGQCSAPLRRNAGWHRIASSRTVLNDGPRIQRMSMAAASCTCPSSADAKSCPGFQRAASSDGSDTNCWNCKKLLDCLNERFFCGSCDSLQPPLDLHSSSYFRCFGLREDYKIDMGKLTLAYRDLQRNIHPDKFASRSESERLIAEQQSSLINKAYWTLVKPLSRAVYMLELKGKPLIDGEVELDAAFLSEMMDLNEAVFEADDQERVREMSNMVKANMAFLEKQLKDHFSVGNIDAARSTVGKMKCYASLLGKIDEKLGYGPAAPTDID